MPAVEPIADLNRRMPEQGRIRIGHQVATKNGKLRPEKLTKLRFTSRDRDAIEQIAQTYGGECRVWDGAPGARQWEVITEAAEIPVVLPPDCLGGTPIYEMWNRGGVMRRCDGTLCDQERSTDDGAEIVKVPCLCANESGARQCKLKTRLTVILRDVRFGGGWRLETGSENAARELPGMVDMIHAMQEQGLVHGVLRLDEREKMKAGRKQQFVIPVLSIPLSLDQIVAGEGAPALSRPAQAAGPALPSGDDEVVEAEVVEVVHPETLAQIENHAATIAMQWNEHNPEGPVSGRQVQQMLAAQLTQRANQQLGALDESNAQKILTLLADILEGRVFITTIQNGRMGVKRNVNRV